MTRTSSFSSEPGAAVERTRAEVAFDRLRDDIIRGVRPPDERLRLERLSKHYAIGPTPLREALQRLCADGLVLAHGNRGFAVAPLDPAEFEDLNIARIAIEKEAVKLAIAQGDEVWEAGVVAAAYRMEKQDAAIERGHGGPLDAWEAANAAFHFATIGACGSRWLLRVRQRLHDQCERYRRASVDLRRSKRDLNGEHRAIAQAVLARDTEIAGTRIEAHFTTTAAILREEQSFTGSIAGR